MKYNTGHQRCVGSAVVAQLEKCWKAREREGKDAGGIRLEEQLYSRKKQGRRKQFVMVAKDIQKRPAVLVSDGGSASTDPPAWP